MGINKLIEEMSTQTLTEFDSEVRFRTLAAAGNTKRGLELLGKLDTRNKQPRLNTEFLRDNFLAREVPNKHPTPYFSFINR